MTAAISIISIPYNLSFFFVRESHIRCHKNAYPTIQVIVSYLHSRCNSLIQFFESPISLHCFSVAFFEVCKKKEGSINNFLKFFEVYKQLYLFFKYYKKSNFMIKNKIPSNYFSYKPQTIST